MPGTPVTLTDETGIERFRGTQQGGGGGSQTLAQVLATGNDAEGQQIANLSVITGQDGFGLGIDAGPSFAQPGVVGAAIGVNAQGSDTRGGDVVWVAGQGDGAPGGSSSMSGGGTSLAGTPGTVLASGAGDTDGGIDLIANGLLTLDGAPFGRAAHVADGSTVDQLRDALIAVGLMEAS